MLDISKLIRNSQLLLSSIIAPIVPPAMSSQNGVAPDPILLFRSPA